MTTEMPSDEVLRRLWHSGLGRLYRESRGHLGRVTSLDDPFERRGLYWTTALLLSLSAASLVLFSIWGMAVVSADLRSVTFVPSLIGLAAGLFCVAKSVAFMRGALALGAALAEGRDGDGADPLRTVTFRRAWRWARRKDLLVGEGEELHLR
ncbi:hypothetical protein KAR29_13160 [Aminithiophilus ramosus]|uniref:Uncharacterized protein n=2 Tax=Synergistales TaxID=649776 RepID=A0A9Q7A7I4_9BACT|nr:hypothetical protein [Aminithiophilus ramosus]QTX32235.1 hypothetical protein KAR29_13160 [Aminithiophilus ramosus]QVL36103.1 hypothetical protein KIH16_13360 [Synergistota bacterium]